MNKKTMLIIAGPNGAGKTTFAPFLHDFYEIEESVNPDIIAEGLSLNPQSVAFHSGRIALVRIQQLIENQISFAYETTLASHTVRHMISHSHRDNYHIRLHFLALPSAGFAKQRVKYRVSQGGHDIPENTIERRFKRGIRNFFDYYQHQVDEWVLYDALNNHEVIAFRSNNSTTIILSDNYRRLESHYD